MGRIPPATSELNLIAHSCTALRRLQGNQLRYQVYKLLTANHIHELYRYRDLILRLAWSDFKLRYKSSALGFFWSLLEPLLMLVVLYVVFSNLMRVQVEHYQLFLLLGIILWNFIDRGTSMSIWGIVGKPSLVQKVYFPRDILVISTCITALMMTALEFVVFIIFMVIFRVLPEMTVAYFPILFILEFFIILGLSMALSALNVYFRDVQFIWRLIVQVGFFGTPILYPITIFPENDTLDSDAQSHGPDNYYDARLHPVRDIA